jgi:hypothetical protein
MIAGWCSRTVRAAVFAAVCVLLAALGHVMMSGASVPWWAMGAGAVATGGAGWCLAGRERGLPLIVSVVVLAQGALHSAFEFAQSALQPAAPGSTGTATMPMASMAMDFTDMNSMASMDMGNVGSGHMAHAGQDMGGTSSFGMFAAHLLAALLCGLWLAYGERAAFRILRAVASRLAAPLRLPLALPAPPHRPHIRVRRSRSDQALRPLLLVHAITSRGPPARAAVV